MPEILRRSGPSPWASSYLVQWLRNQIRPETVQLIPQEQPLCRPEILARIGSETATLPFLHTFEFEDLVHLCRKYDWQFLDIAIFGGSLPRSAGVTGLERHSLRYGIK